MQIQLSSLTYVLAKILTAMKTLWLLIVGKRLRNILDSGPYLLALPRNRGVRNAEQRVTRHKNQPSNNCCDFGSINSC